MNDEWKQVISRETISLPDSLMAYHGKAISTYNKEKIAKVLGKHTILYPALKLNGESGEVAEKIGKIVRDHGGEITLSQADEIIKELGDVLWYICAIAEELGTDLYDVALANVHKLQSRKERGVIHGSGDNR